MGKIGVRQVEITGSAPKANRPGRCQRLKQDRARACNDVVNRDVVRRQGHVVLIKVVRCQDGQCAVCCRDRDVYRCCVQIRAVKGVDPEVFGRRDDDLTSIARPGGRREERSVPVSRYPGGIPDQDRKSAGSGGCTIVRNFTTRQNDVAGCRRTRTGIVARG